MKHRKLLDKAVVAALLLAYVPGLAEDMLPEPDPAALFAPALSPAGDAAGDDHADTDL